MTADLTLDFSLALARPVAVARTRRIHLIQVGCGGTGSHFAGHLAVIAQEAQRQGYQVAITFVDHDVVERGNLGRSLFVSPEIGMHKAVTLATRYGGGHGLDITADTRPFEAQRYLPHGSQTLTICIGCVDRASARVELAAMLDHNTAYQTSIWWLDLNNDATSGRVLLGSTAQLSILRHAFDDTLWCTMLPAPQLVYPDQLTPRPEELDDHPLSCQQLQQANAQSLCINMQVAALGAQFLAELLLTRELRRFTTTLSATAGVARSHYTTPEGIAAAVSLPTLFDPPAPRTA